MLCLIFLGLISSLCVSWGADTFANHVCKRECITGAPPMICEYNLTVEWYWVLSKACYECPFNITDCWREECVSADGQRRAVLTYNKQLPGPKIEVCAGDTVRVWVKNMMLDGEVTSVHWHGQHQSYTPYMDGVAFITQCAINLGHVFKYEFKVGPTGTHWYHSHVGLQIADGLYGPFIVREPKDSDPHGSLYDEDLSDHIVMIGDWKPLPFINRFMHQMNDRFIVEDPATGLINGRAMEIPVQNYNSSIPSAKTPMSEFFVEQGKRYRFRFIGAASACQFQVSIDDHMMTVIANDGVPVKPITVDTFILTPGERYDIIINANQTVGNYWMKAIGLGDCRRLTWVQAIIRYDASSTGVPPGDPKTHRQGVLLNFFPDQFKDAEHGYNHTQVIAADEIQYGVTDTNFTDEVVHNKYFTSMFFSNNDNTIFNNKHLYPVKSLKLEQLHATPVMDNITFTIPPVPILSQPEDVNESWFCNKSTLIDTDICLDDLCICTHLVRFPLGQTIELIVINEGSMFPGAHHPMHLHGYSFRIMGVQTYDRPIKVEEVESLDKQGKLKRNFINPPLRDTFMIPARSYAVLRFKANNPGYWFFHCHVDGHVVQGKAFLIKIGEVSEFPEPPADFPVCGGYGYQPKKQVVKETVYVDTCTSASSRSYLSLFSVAVVVLSSLLHEYSYH